MTTLFRVARDIEQQLRADEGVQAAVERAAEAVLEDAKAHVPVDTGELRDSLRVEDGPDGRKRIVAGTDHWQYPEFGTIDMEPEPYLRPALGAAGLKRT